MTLWRLSNSEFLAGGAHPTGRWVPAGANIVMLHGSPESAICARLALVEAEHPRKLPRSYRLLEVTVPRASVRAPAVPRNWHADIAATRAFGQSWLAAGDSLVLQVPALSGAPQYLLNCTHPEMRLCRVVSQLAAPFHPHFDALAAVVSDEMDWLAKTSSATRDESVT